MAGRTGSITRRERLSGAARVVLGAGGGYGIAALTTALPSLARPEAVATATLVGFLLILVVVVIVFALHSLHRAALTLTGTAPALGGLLALAMRGTP